MSFAEVCRPVGEVGVCGGGGAGPFLTAAVLNVPPAAAIFLCSLPPPGVSACSSPVDGCSGTISLATGNTGVGTLTAPPLMFDEEDDVLMVVSCVPSALTGEVTTGGGAGEGAGWDFFISVFVSTLGGGASSGAAPAEPGAPTVVGAGPIFDLLGSSSVVGTGVDSFESLDDFERDVGVSGTDAGNGE